ncbi:protease HtpX [Solimonas terrae]|uniref:Protease HtpX n=1 Tax=Solimonas terrae TaxID=1396819 RepID=A0A6M2BME6_9GAMM|nr:protease HtpX [Solimonas terrae]NGY03588.1 protease HtpX [Solimonas terrae]
MKRVLLFLATNLAIVLILSVVTSLLGVNHWLMANGLNYSALLVFCFVFGMGGAFISLALSKPIAKWTTGARVLKEPRSSSEMWLLQTVERQARAAGVGMPEVAIFDAPEPNAFATGMSRNNSLVAVSTGLLHSMSQDEVEAVLGHEMSHIANGDMVTLTLIQGVLNTFVMFLARVIGYAIDQAVFRRGADDRGPGIGYFFTVMILQLVFGILASMIVAWFSRRREFRADAGGAHLAGKRKMIAALQRLQAAHGESSLPQNMTAMGITGGQLARLFASHPPLEVRIAALQQAQTA